MNTQTNDTKTRITNSRELMNDMIALPWKEMTTHER